jgi:hypothetical protein
MRNDTLRSDGIGRRARVLAAGALLAACSVGPLGGLGTPLASPAALTPASAASPAPADSGWTSTETDGLERRAVTVPFAEVGLVERLVLFRADLVRLALRVRYTPGFPFHVADWDRQARLVFNAGFFDENDAALGLVVADGQAFGRSYETYGGMLAVDPAGAVSLRWLPAQPHLPGEALSQAVQSFPMLIRPDGTAYADEDGGRARRTAVGLDDQGRLVVIIAPDGLFTLAGLAAWLHGSDLGLTAALNLDGGGSTGYYAGPNDTVNSFTPVPAVVALYAR